ncbi:TetR/AcrR family transcriptional regulator [Nocardioides sp. cx-173]|uniref:TetR/AcrR family transcriptional regulator n=1 Tax=Nocardioides sp. cx-173 TaxID=2898796 RepID=UPI001E543A85|nr:TetR/AcrR family transcriptional regulator [Nocardioides sp. cx-173]MCD4524847.1 TetR/AcrR family transcriptional regulator [Nocardioides sp. cx-173]UGB43352.1 TetR/AcrR family transcriptional regulator [Nocardioides sp. cx-173]
MTTTPPAPPASPAPPAPAAPSAGTPARPSAARERILVAADRLFYNEGIHAVGIQRIIAESRVTRVTLYRHFPSKDDLISAYLERRAAYDHDQVNGVIDAHPDDPRQALDELATALTGDDFGAVRRGCPFINSSAEFPATHPVRVHALEIRRWVTERIEELLRRLGRRDARSTAEQLMMVRTGAVVSASLDGNEHLNHDFLACWGKLIDDGLPGGSQAG